MIKEFVSNNFRTIVLVASFIVTLYIQHVNNTAQIHELNARCATLEVKIADQYEKIDAIKLDKAVFEATILQFTSMRTDIHEMRQDIKELLKNKR